MTLEDYQQDICIFFGSYSSWLRQADLLTTVHRAWLLLICVRLEQEDGYNYFTQGLTALQREHLASILALIHPFDPAAERKLFRLVMPELGKKGLQPLTIQQAAAAMLAMDVDAQLAVHGIIYNSVCLFEQMV